MAAVFQGQFGAAEKVKGYKDRGGSQRVSVKGKVGCEADFTLKAGEPECSIGQ